MDTMVKSTWKIGLKHTLPDQWHTRKQKLSLFEWVIKERVCASKKGQVKKLHINTLWFCALTAVYRVFNFHVLRVFEHF
jgi:hypothetical protein